ncbi:MAG: hypothetical protein AAB804_00280 [Patescibacteria group bacterium]
MNRKFPAKIYREDPHHRIPTGWLDDPTYAAAMTGFVIVCTDAMVIDRVRRTVWLADRTILPMKGLWILGGRRLPGEAIEASIQRCLEREARLTFARERFEYLTQNEYVWSTRQQEPRNVGSHNLADTFAIELTKDERDTVSRSLTPKEYKPGGLREFDRQGLRDAKVHPALLDLYDLVF